VAKAYIGQVIEQVNLVTEKCGSILLFGENIDTGSRISGLARGLEVGPTGRILNVGNCELTHIGVGLGMMLDGGKAAVFMKQLDFLLLGIDHLINTYNSIRAFSPTNGLGSFTIFPIVCDQGFQGPQSSFGGTSDIASMANIDVFCLNATEDVASIISTHFVSPGFRVICTSQRLFGSPALELSAVAHSPDCAVFHYRTGSDVTLVCYNFSLRSGVAIAEDLGVLGVESDLFHVNFVPGMDIALLSASCERTGKLVLLDDSKSVTKFGDMLVTQLRNLGLDFAILLLGRRGCSAGEYGVSEDIFSPDPTVIRAFLGKR